MFDIQLKDCMEYMDSMTDNSVELTITDIPYDVVNRSQGNLSKMGSLDKGDADIITFDINKFVEEVVRVTKNSIYIFCSTEQAGLIRGHLVNLGLTTRHCIWEKPDYPPINGQYFWLSSIENCIFARKKKAPFNEFCKSVVWRETIERSIKNHPTPKPVLLLKRLIEASSNEGDTVFDPCMGSGSTGLACKMTDRNFIGCDVNPEYVENAIQRIESLDLKNNPWLKKLNKRAISV
jgi:site-specific DNA-methyltransferase (adenine-specific)